MNKIKDAFDRYGSSGDRTQLKIDLSEIRSELGDEYFSQIGHYLDLFFDDLILSEEDRIKSFLMSSGEFKKFVIEKTNGLDHIEEVTSSIEKIFGAERKAKINIENLSFSLGDKKLEDVLLNLYGLKPQFYKIEKSVEFLKEIDSPEKEIESSFILDKTGIIFGAEEKVTKKKKNAIASFMESFSKMDISIETVGKAATVAFLAASVFSSTANAGSREVAEYIGFSEMKKSDYYTKMFFEERRGMSPEHGRKMHKLLSKVNFEPEVKLIKHSFNKKTNSGEFTIKVGDCKTMGAYASNGPIEFRTGAGDENRECFELTKGFETLLSNKFNALLKMGN